MKTGADDTWPEDYEPDYDSYRKDELIHERNSPSDTEEAPECNTNPVTVE